MNVMVASFRHRGRGCRDIPSESDAESLLSGWKSDSDSSSDAKIGSAVKWRKVGDTDEEGDKKKKRAKQRANAAEAAP